jgi:hypothetical protein
VPTPGSREASIPNLEELMNISAEYFPSANVDISDIFERVGELDEPQFIELGGYKPSADAKTLTASAGLDQSQISISYDQYKELIGVNGQFRLGPFYDTSDDQQIIVSNKTEEYGSVSRGNGGIVIHGAPEFIKEVQLSLQKQSDEIEPSSGGNTPLY